MFSCSVYFPKGSETCWGLRGRGSARPRHHRCSRCGTTSGCWGHTPLLCNGFCVYSSVIRDLSVQSSGPCVVQRKRKRSHARKLQVWFSKGSTQGRRGRSWSLALKTSYSSTTLCHLPSTSFAGKRLSFPVYTETQPGKQVAPILTIRSELDLSFLLPSPVSSYSAICYEEWSQEESFF